MSKKKVKKYSKIYIESRYNKFDIAEMLSLVDTDMKEVALSMGKSLKMLGRKKSPRGMWIHTYWWKRNTVFAFVSKHHINYDWKDIFKGSVTMGYMEAIKRLQKYIREGKIKIEDVK